MKNLTWQNPEQLFVAQELINKVKSKCCGIKVKYTRKEKLLFDFFCLVIEFHTVSRDVAFYAKKMCVSAKHLTMVITDMSGRSAKDWIIDYSLLEIKALLRDSDLEIKEVASRTNFQSNSVMTRFFREHTGMTPSEYRERIYVKNEIDL